MWLCKYSLTFSRLCFLYTINEHYAVCFYVPRKVNYSFVSSACFSSCLLLFFQAMLWQISNTICGNNKRKHSQSRPFTGVFFHNDIMNKLWCLPPVLWKLICKLHVVSFMLNSRKNIVFQDGHLGQKMQEFPQSMKQSSREKSGVLFTRLVNL